MTTLLQLLDSVRKVEKYVTDVEAERDDLRERNAALQRAVGNLERELAAIKSKPIVLQTFDPVESGDIRLLREMHQFRELQAEF